jgi:aspartate aminotransferase
VTAFECGPEIERYLTQSRRILRALGRSVSQRLRNAGVNAPAPDGAFYLYPDFTPQAERLRARGLTTSADFCEQLLADTGVALLPGSDFGRPATELACRLAYVDFDGAKCLLAAERIPLEEGLGEQFLIEHCGRVLTAIDLLGEWL